QEIEFDSPLGGGGRMASKDFSVLPPTPKGEMFFANYSPLVTLTTKNLTDHIEIRIHDNGFGIPPNIIDKIFQPFFTTKPSGQGTGLGLSLAYDIIKAHNGSLSVTSNNREPGDIKVESIEARRGAGSEFTITLPI
ncbi:MAG: HAMP domain-containing sensor histidine kinase, partial [Saprospiraceae bacterium]